MEKNKFKKKKKIEKRKIGAHEKNERIHSRVAVSAYSHFDQLFFWFSLIKHVFKGLFGIWGNAEKALLTVLTSHSRRLKYVGRKSN